jgi:hypothetical protein
VKGACVKALVIALWSHGGEGRTLCMFARVEFLKDLWIGFIEGSNRESNRVFRLEENFGTSLWWILA